MRKREASGLGHTRLVGFEKWCAMLERMPRIATMSFSFLSGIRSASIVRAMTY